MTRSASEKKEAAQEIETVLLLGAGVVPIGAPASPTSSLSPAAVEDLEAAKTGDFTGDKAARLETLRLRHDAECPHCTQVTTHTRTVFGEGSPDARLMFVGEAPGAEEDRQGRPFVGRSGQLLTKMIQAMGLKREDVYIANVLKSRPPNNATPSASEAALCGPYLLEQVGIIEPEAIVTLGKPAAQLLLQTNEPMGKMRGTWRDWQGTPVMPTFHPAYLLRSYTPENRAKVWSDLCQARDRLGISGPAADAE